jgi:hypothetical protein
MRVSPGHFDDWARFVRKLAAGSSVRSPVNRTKRLYLETVACGVVRVEHRSIKNELAERSSVDLPGRERELTSMTTFDRFSIKVVAGIGLCGAAIALSPGAIAAPLKTGGAACMYGSAGEAAAPAAAGAAGAAGAACAPAGAPIADMAGAPVAAPIPGGLPFPAGAPVPAGAGAPLPVAVPAGAPLIALGGLPAAPVVDMAGVAGGKGAPTGSAPTTGPLPGQPLPPGPPE